MAKLDSLCQQWAPRLLSVLRIITGFLFVPHGAQKLFGLLGARSGGPPPLFSEMWFAGVLEFFGGLLILAGLFTRPAAFILSGMMAVAYFKAHAPQGFWPVQNRGELAALYCFVFFYLSAAGAGPWGLDSIWRRGRT
ncbi:MAG: DoxX family protein [Blastocatellia bacterium]